MKSSKSINSLASQQQQHHQQQLQEQSDSSNDTGTSVARRPQPMPPPTSSEICRTSMAHPGGDNGPGAPTSPICRCRVMYLGSSVPHITKDGLQGIQEPLRELYPDTSSLTSGNAGIDSWLSVWSNGILVENIDETGRQVKRFFKIEALHYCAAVKYVPQTTNQQQQQHQLLNGNPNISNATTNGDNLQNFLPLDSPHARMQANTNPPIFASILRRTTGVKVLECHAFICKREAAANALVRCCFHAYADTMYAKQIGADVDKLSCDLNNNSNTNSLKSNQTIQAQLNPRLTNGNQRSTLNSMAPTVVARRSKSIANLNDSNNDRDYNSNSDDSNFSHVNNGANYATMRPRVMPNDSYVHMNGDLKHQQQQQMQNINENLSRQHKFSKSMHHLDQYQDQFNQIYSRPGDVNDGMLPPNLNQSTSYHNLSRLHQQPQMISPPQQPFYNPYASRVPSYPPQNLIDQQQSTNGGGTMRSIKSVAGNSIASTLLRSKKHAKAMSMAQINNSQQDNKNNIISFHQPQSNGSTLRGVGNSFVLPPVPPMFLPNLATINGSQTMKIPNRSMIHPLAGQPMNFEAMTPKEMKKLLKKSAKYGIDPSKFGDNGLPLFPLRPIPPPPPQLPPHMQQPFFPTNKSGTFGGHSLLSMDMQMNGGVDTQDFRHHHQGLPPPQQMMIPPPAMMGPMGPAFQHDFNDQQAQAPIKSILVKPNPEFLKSKAGKKWLKQQKEFKKLLPPHLEGLPIVFGPPPADALEPASVSDANAMQSPASHHHQQQQQQLPPPFVSPPLPGLPMMDSSGYYNPHPFYGPSGRASAASTLLRYSPRSQNFHHEGLTGGANVGANMPEYLDRSQSMYSNTMKPTMSMNQMRHQQQQQLRQDLSGDSSSLVYGNTELRVPDSRQFQFNGSEQHPRHKQRNHMIEQRVISLGDENDLEEDDGQINGHGDDDDDDDGSGKVTGYYQQVGQSQSVSRSSRNPDSRTRRNEQESQQQDYEQVMPPNDDQSSYSSGIYKRGHINERAFSYSIQQEHRTSAANSDIEYATGDRSQHATDYNRIRDQHQATYDSPNISNDMFHNNRHERSVDRYSNEQQSVNQLAARVESQLNFADSRIKSHM